MTHFFRTYPLTILVVAAICYLSFFTPPETDMNEIPYIDKVVHVCMYGGLASTIWFEYLRAHRSLGKMALGFGAVAFPILMSGIIEILQETCTENRGGEWLDFAANTTGVVLAAIVGYYVMRPLVWKWM